MADDNQSQSTINCVGAVTVRQRPAVLLMKVRLRATEPTLELGLARLKTHSEATAQWLKRLGAQRVDFGEPHFAEQADTDPMSKMRAMATRALRKRPTEDETDQRPHGVCLVLTAIWPVAAMSAEEILVLVDRLRFEAAEDSDEVETPDALPPWASPEEQMQEMVTQMQQPPADDSPQFLFVARLDEVQREKAAAEAFARARQNAERLARAAGMRLGAIRMIHHMMTGGLDGSRPDRMMDRQRCLGMLAGSSYDLGEHEIVSDDPRAAEFTISVNVSYSAE